MCPYTLTHNKKIGLLALATAYSSFSAYALEKTDTTYPIYQFSTNSIPRIDGDTNDWSLVSEKYAVRTAELWDDSGKHPSIKPESLDVSVKVGWVKGENRLYFLYEAYDDYWDFALPGLKNDTFELIVDADLSGGPLTTGHRRNQESVSEQDAWWSMQGAHAQNYHIFTPARNKSWCMLWGPAQWLKKIPYSNFAYVYDFEPGKAGKLTLEFYITPFDFADPNGPNSSTVSELEESKLIGLGWAIIDYDDVDSPRNNGFWNLSPEHKMYTKTEHLLGFRLMPLEEVHRPALECFWTTKIVDKEQRIAAFFDHSTGRVIERIWDFGDGETSSAKNPIHQYAKPGKYTVILTVKTEAGEDRYSRVWDVAF